MIKAVRPFESNFHVPCLAQTINLAVQKSLNVKRVSHVLAKIRRIVAFFHRSPIANNLLKVKAALLSLPQHNLIMDVSTCWNSVYDMAARFLEMRCAVITVLMTKEMSKLKGRDLPALSDEDIFLMEEVIQCLKPMKDITTMLCKEKSPTISIIMPLRHQLLGSILCANDEDIPAVTEMKRIMASDLKTIYSGLDKQEMLHLASAVDPRFKLLPYMSDAQRFDLFGKMVSETAAFPLNCKSETEPNIDPPLPDLSESQTSANGTTSAQLTVTAQSTSGESLAEVDSTSLSSCPKSILEGLLGEVFVTKKEPAKSPFELAQLEVAMYQSEPGITLADNSLTWWNNHEYRFPRLSKLAKCYCVFQRPVCRLKESFPRLGTLYLINEHH